MSYQISYLSVLKALFIPVDIVFLFLTAGIPLFIIAMVLCHLKKTNNRRYLGMTLGLVIVIPLLTMLVVSLTNAGSGWRLEDDKLIIKASPVSDTIDLPPTKAALVDTSGPWQPVLREKGFGSPGLSTGWFKLQNGNKAVVFRHMTSPKTLVLLSNDHYYLLTHPGIERLYQELVARGVKRNAL